MQAKSCDDNAMQVALRAWFTETALTGVIRIQLRTDGRPAIETETQAAALRRAPEAHLETTLVESSDRLEACESFAGTVADLVRHVIFLYKGFPPHPRGGTAYEHLPGRQDTSVTSPFGRTVPMWRTDAMEHRKQLPRWLRAEFDLLRWLCANQWAVPRLPTVLGTQAAVPVAASARATPTGGSCQARAVKLRAPRRDGPHGGLLCVHGSRARASTFDGVS